MLRWLLIWNVSTYSCKLFLCLEPNITKISVLSRNTDSHRWMIALYQFSEADDASNQGVLYLQRVSWACCWLATKLEEQPKSLRDIVSVFYRVDSRRSSDGNGPFPPLDIYSQVYSIFIDVYIYHCYYCYYLLFSLLLFQHLTNVRPYCFFQKLWASLCHNIPTRYISHLLCV